TVKFLVLGQELASRATLLLPKGLYIHNVDAIPGRTEQYGSVDDILQVVERERPDIVFLVAGYLLCPHLQFTPEDLERLVALLRARGCRVVTADPFVGLLSKRGPREVIRLEFGNQAAAIANVPGAVDEFERARRAVEERTWASFSHSERVL